MAALMQRCNRGHGLFTMYPWYGTAQAYRHDRGRAASTAGVHGCHTGFDVNATLSPAYLQAAAACFMDVSGSAL